MLISFYWLLKKKPNIEREEEKWGNYDERSKKNPKKTPKHFESILIETNIINFRFICMFYELK